MVSDALLKVQHIREYVFEIFRAYSTKLLFNQSYGISSDLITAIRGVSWPVQYMIRDLSIAKMSVNDR